MFLKSAIALSSMTVDYRKVNVSSDLTQTALFSILQNLLLDSSSCQFFDGSAKIPSQPNSFSSKHELDRSKPFVAPNSTK